MKLLLTTSVFATAANVLTLRAGHWRVLAWTALMATALLLALLLQALAASALGAPGAAVRADVCRASAGAALADGDDVRAGFLTGLCVQANAPRPGP